MKSTEFSKAVRTLLLKLHVITGWVIPGDEMRLILQDQLSKRIQESFCYLNPDEIEFAFRNGSDKVEDWGKEMNLKLLEKVLVPYLNNRFELSRLEEKRSDKPVQKIYTEDENLNENRKTVQQVYEKYLKDPRKVYYFPTRLIYETLLFDGFIKPGTDVVNFFAQCANLKKEKLYSNE